MVVSLSMLFGNVPRDPLLNGQVKSPGLLSRRVTSVIMRSIALGPVAAYSAGTLAFY